jgi:hypothetical protein
MIKNVIVENGQPRIVENEFSAVFDGVTYNFPSRWLESATIQEKQEKNIFEVEFNETPPPGKIFSGTEVYSENNIPFIVPIFENEPRVAISDLVSDKLRALADYRWNKCQWFTYDGVKTQADSAISVVTAKVVVSQFLPPETSHIWKLSDTEFRVWTFPDIVQFGIAINGYIQSCFDLEKQHSISISKLITAQEINDYDFTIGWPD